MNEKLLEDATIRLLKTLGELTPDTEINDAIIAMSVATVRIKRLQEEVDANWIPVVKGKEPIGKVLVAFDNPFFGCYDKEAECACFEDGVWQFWLSGKEISTHENGVTHYKTISGLPDVAKKEQ